VQSQAIVPEESLEPAWTQCPLCAARGPFTSELVLQASPPVELLECAQCGGGSASRMPTDAYCATFYSAGYAAGHVEVTQGNARSFATHLSKALANVALPRQLRLLDFGGNDGSMALALVHELLNAGRVDGARIVVLDHVPAVRCDDPRIELSAGLRLEELPQDERFDAVIASAVIEHIPHAQPVLQELLARVAPSGWFYARTPWVAPLVKRVPRLPLMLWPAHVHDLGRAFWNGVCERAPNFRIVLSRPSWVETSWRRQPLRTAAAYLLKAPAQLDARVRPSYRGTLDWPFVGGWEIVMQRA
jgi:SAM-dependent methyltransferase